MILGSPVPSNTASCTFFSGLFGSAGVADSLDFALSMVEEDLFLLLAPEDDLLRVEV